MGSDKPRRHERFLFLEVCTSATLLPPRFLGTSSRCTEETFQALSQRHSIFKKMSPSETDVGDHAAVQPVAVEKSVSPSVQQDVSSNEKKVYNVEVLERSDSPAESIISTDQQHSRQIVGTRLQRCGAVLLKFARFTGPGTLISVAYVDPDNFQTALDAGAQFQYKLLFITLLGVLMAVFLQVTPVTRAHGQVLMESRHWQPSLDVSRG
jgi:hypothetical protein